MVKVSKWDSVEYLQTEEDIAHYFKAYLDENGDDAAFIAKARGMTQLSKQTNMGRESLYKAFSGEGNPSFATILKVINALGLKIEGSLKV